MSATSTDTGVELTAVTMGIDHFERASAHGESLLDGEGLVPIYIGDDVVAPRAYANWEDIFADLDALAERADVTAPDARGVFLTSMVRSVKTAARLFSGETMRYSEKVRDLVGAEPAPTAEARVAELSDQLDRALTGSGFVRGTLRDRVEA